MLPFGVIIQVSVPQRSEIPEGLLNYPVFTLPTLPLYITFRSCTPMMKLEILLNLLCFIYIVLHTLENQKYRTFVAPIHLRQVCDVVCNKRPFN
jgi:hypothetical protein